MGLKQKLEEELKTALKAGKKEAVAAYRLTLADILGAEKEKREPLDEKEEPCSFSARPSRSERKR